MPRPPESSDTEGQDTITPLQPVYTGLEGELGSPPDIFTEHLPRGGARLKMTDSGLGLIPGELADRFGDQDDRNVAQHTRRRAIIRTDLEILP